MTGRVPGHAGSAGTPPAGGDGPATPPPDPLAELTGREVEILRMAASGLSNSAIAKAASLSVRTVERHLSNAYLKLGVSGRAARAAAVADLIRRGMA
jgi:DNA-binding NarL/FixJ family response regulator